MRGALIHVATKLERPVAEALRAYAGAQRVTVSEAARMLLKSALTSVGTLDGPPSSRTMARDDGYNDGVRRGLREARVAIREALASLWK